MTDLLTVRLPIAGAERMSSAELREYLTGQGIDTRTMTARVHGADLVYEGARVTKDNGVTKGNEGLE